MSLVKKGLSDSKYYLIANLGNKALAFLVIPILAKTVGIEEFATYDLFLIISNILLIFVMLGMDSGVIILLTESKDDDKKLSFYYVSTLIISFLILIILTSILSFIFLYIDELFLLSKQIWLYICFHIFFHMINYHTYNFLRWREKAKQASFITLFSYLAGMIIGLVFLYLENSVEAYLRGLVIGLSFGAMASLYISKEYIFKFSIVHNYKERLRELIKLSLPFMPNYLGNNLMEIADRVIILLLFDKYELGLYALISKLAMIPQIIMGTVTGGFLPVMFRNYETEKGRQLIRNFFHLYLILIPVAFIIAYPLADWAITLFAGSNYVEASYLLPMMLVSILFVQSGQANGFGYLIKRKTHYVMYITFVALVLNYMLSLLFGYWIGLAGVILGTLIVGIIKTYFLTYFSERLHSFGYSFKLIITVSMVSFILVLLSIKVT